MADNLATEVIYAHRLAHIPTEYWKMSRQDYTNDPQTKGRVARTFVRHPGLVNPGRFIIFWLRLYTMYNRVVKTLLPRPPGPACTSCAWGILLGDPECASLKVNRLASETRSRAYRLPNRDPTRQPVQAFGTRPGRIVFGKCIGSPRAKPLRQHGASCTRSTMKKSLVNPIKGGPGLLKLLFSDGVLGSSLAEEESPWETRYKVYRVIKRESPLPNRYRLYQANEQISALISGTSRTRSPRQISTR
jgi:hypothetical protein